MQITALSKITSPSSTKVGIPPPDSALNNLPIDGGSRGGLPVAVGTQL